MKSIWASAGGVAVVFTGAVWFVDSAQTFESYYDTYIRSYKKPSGSAVFGSHAWSRSLPMSFMPVIGSMENLFRCDFDFSRGMSKRLSPVAVSSHKMIPGSRSIGADCPVIQSSSG
jgi:hypothetical protein